MPPTSVDKMLESMMMQMFNPNQKAANVCCNCFKVKKKESQRSSNTSCKCRSAPKKLKKRHRKLKSSCLKTIVCLTKIAKHGANECEGCSCYPCSGNMGRDEDSKADERFCSKCGQLLPGMTQADPPLSQPGLQCLEQLQRCQQKCKDMAVQASVDHKEPLSVRIKVCPCTNVSPRNQDSKLYHSVSLPELSSTDPRLVDRASSGNLFNSRGPHAKFDDSYNEESRQSQHVVNETTPKWPVNDASIKKLALNMAKARLIEEVACWEREHARRHLQRETYEHAEQPTDEPSDVDRRKSAMTNGFGQGQTAPNATEYKTEMRTQSFPNYNQLGCCAGTDVYCYSPQNGPSPFSDHCEHECTCGNAHQYQPYQTSEPYSGYQYQNMPHQQQFGLQQDRSRPDQHVVSYGTMGNRLQSPCR